MIYLEKFLEVVMQAMNRFLLQYSYFSMTTHKAELNKSINHCMFKVFVAALFSFAVAHGLTIARIHSTRNEVDASR